MDLQADLRMKVSRFEDVLRARIPSHLGDDLAVRVLRELYATRSAFEVLSQIAMLFPHEVESGRSLTDSEDQTSVQRTLPSSDAVKSAATRLFAAVDSADNGEMVKALKEMGVYAFCPSNNQMFGRLEFCTRSVIGHPRLIVLVELAIFAAELEAYARASGYLAEAKALFPGPSELHDVHTVEGMIALSVGNKGEATRHLAESIRVCQEDDFARVVCTIRAPNLMLAEKLLRFSEQKAVITYLVQCQHVWLYLAKQIDSWIDAIQNGGGPESLLPSGILCAMNRPAIKLQTLMIKASSLGNALDSLRPHRGSNIGPEKMLIEYKRRMAAAISGKLETDNN